MSSFYITCVDGTSILNVVETNTGSFELCWEDNYQCNLGTFETYEAAVDAIYKYYGRGRVIKC
ncbi:MAG: hypothetical protein H9W82_17350 [Lactobacillus sp.]|nr:hypothetical protein [Lactobacillus sp.]